MIHKSPTILVRYIGSKSLFFSKGAFYKVHCSILRKLRYIGQKYLDLLTAKRSDLPCLLVPVDMLFTPTGKILKTGSSRYELDQQIRAGSQEYGSRKRVRRTRRPTMVSGTGPSGYHSSSSQLPSPTGEFEQPNEQANERFFP